MWKFGAAGAAACLAASWIRTRPATPAAHRTVQEEEAQCRTLRLPTPSEASAMAPVRFSRLLGADEAARLRRDVAEAQRARGLGMLQRGVDEQPSGVGVWETTWVVPPIPSPHAPPNPLQIPPHGRGVPRSHARAAREAAARDGARGRRGGVGAA